MFKALKWEDWVGIALGAWMLVSPWVVGFSDHGAATMNALVMGTILVLEELLELVVHEMAEEWIDLVAGLWLMISPIVLGFASLTLAALSTMAVGLLVVLFAAWAMSPLDKKLSHWWHDHVTGH
jgi:SPW repeat